MFGFLKSPLVRISFGLVMLTVSLLLLSNIFGLFPNTRQAELQSRKAISESLAVQFAVAPDKKKLNEIYETLRSIVERNDNVLSAGLRRDKGGLLVQFGDHDRRWIPRADDRSTATHVQVPLLDGDIRWGTVELVFSPLSESGFVLSWRNSLMTVILLVAVAGFLGYWLFLKRTMRELDPNAVIPDRVRKALDTLAEGLLIVDDRGVIVFSNHSFARKTGLVPGKLVGKASDSLPWELDAADSACHELPWYCLLQGGELPSNRMVKLQSGPKTAFTFAVNASPITTDKEKVRGALVTFDDVTEIEKKNDELQRTLDKLEQTQREITRQNQELLVLATRDPLTGVLNRRSLFQGFDVLFNEAREELRPLACIMVDIDHFKSVNDRFGHAVGDKVIKLLAKILTDFSRPNDLVGRFGGEEFCVALPGADKPVAAEIAERMRRAVQEGHGAKFTDAMRITSSFGVSDLTTGASDVAQLVDQADKALYVAKETGRNRVIQWSDDLATEEIAEETNNSPPPSPPEQAEPAQAPTAPEAEVIPFPGTEDENEIQQPNYSPETILLFDRIDQAIRRSGRYKTQLAVMVMEVDALQRVNETYGFAAGEKFSKSLIARLKGTLRGTDTVSLTDETELLFSISHLGGKQIVILLTDLKNTEIVTAILQRLFSSIRQSIEVEGTEFFVDADVGVSLHPLDGVNADTLLSHASSAMREAKRAGGRNCFQFYSEDINIRSKRRIQLEADLHRALERDELVVYFQPKVDLRSGAILGMEALLRWQHPQLGLLMPNEFIPLAEQSRMIDHVGQWVLRHVCRQILAWQQAGLGRYTVAINISPVEFRKNHLAEDIIATVEAVGVAPECLEIEITETVVMQNMETAVGTLTQLSEAGFPISVDDFGTGYSSLSYLKKFPLNKVKIDRSFISDSMHGTNDAALVNAVIAMAHSLGLVVVAEGVETEEQLRFLQDLQCDEIQGYLVSKPLPIDELNELLMQSTGIKRRILDSGGDRPRYGTGQSAAGILGILNAFPGDRTGGNQAVSGKN